MNPLQITLSVPEAQATLAFPEGMTNEALIRLEEASSTMLRALRNCAYTARPDDAGSVEYDSWTAGAAEYASWT